MEGGVDHTKREKSLPLLGFIRILNHGAERREHQLDFSNHSSCFFSLCPQLLISVPYKYSKLREKLVPFPFQREGNLSRSFPT